MKSCDEVLELLPDALPWLRGEGLAVHEHLKLCGGCAEAADELASTVELLREAAPPAPQPGPELADRVLAALGPPQGVAPPRVIRGSRWGWAQAAAALACFAAGLGSAVLVERAETSTIAIEPFAPPAPPAPLTPTPAGWPGSGAVAREDPVQHYVHEASLVLQAVDRLDARANPRVIQLLAAHLQETALVEQGDRLLLAIRAVGPGSDEEPLRSLHPLISGTQLILRKVRHAPSQDPAQAVWAIRQEVRQTGILEAQRALLETAARRPPAGADEPL